MFPKWIDNGEKNIILVRIRLAFMLNLIIVLKAKILNKMWTPILFCFVLLCITMDMVI